MARALELSWAERGEVECLRVRGWESGELARLRNGAAEVVALFPADAARDVPPASLQPIAGTFVVEGDELWFRPRFPFRAGLRYVLLVAAAGSWRTSAAERCELAYPDSGGGPTTVVTSIHPTCDIVPLNLLKFYVEFSAPMSEGFARKAITLRRDDGSVIEDAFAPMEPELWDPGRRRLTVLLDPARIKRGLVPHEEAGYPLTEGERVTLRVGRSFRDAGGLELTSAAERSFEVGAALRAWVVPRAWRLSRPQSGTSDALTVRFDRALDHGLLRHCLSVIDAKGVAVEGSGAPLEGDGGWRFTPNERWRRGRYELKVDPRLEDLAGNSVRRLFDEDVESDPPADPGASLVRWEVT